MLSPFAATGTSCAPASSTCICSVGRQALSTPSTLCASCCSTPNKDKNLGSWNFGAYSNATIDEVYPSIVSEVDAAARQGQIDTVHKAMRDDTAYVPLHVQPLVWATQDNIELSQRADNFFILRWVTVK